MKVITTEPPSGHITARTLRAAIWHTRQPPWASASFATRVLMDRECHRRFARFLGHRRRWTYRLLPRDGAMTTPDREDVTDAHEASNALADTRRPVNFAMPAPARRYRALSGKPQDALPTDRESVPILAEAFPAIVAAVAANRAFVRRAVRRLCAENGVQQFVDIGAGLPDAPNDHEVAQLVAPEARVVYVDNDPVMTRRRWLPRLRGSGKEAVTARAHPTRRIASSTGQAPYLMGQVAASVRRGMGGTGLPDPAQEFHSQEPSPAPGLVPIPVDATTAINRLAWHQDWTARLDALSCSGASLHNESRLS